MQIEQYASTAFGEPRRTLVAYFPAPIPRRLDLPSGTIRLLADAEAALGTFPGSVSSCRTLTC